MLPRAPLLGPAHPAHLPVWVPVVQCGLDADGCAACLPDPNGSDSGSFVKFSPPPPR